MARYLLDTNILLRVYDKGSSSHDTALGAIEWLIGSGHDLYLTAQNIVEFWSVATRPIESNGLGWTVDDAAHSTTDLLQCFGFIEETTEIFKKWQELVQEHNVHGKKVHDTRLVAVMLTHDIVNLLTFNDSDFTRFSEITCVHPQAIA